MIDCILKSNHWRYDIKDLNGETVIGNFKSTRESYKISSDGKVRLVELCY